MAANRDEAERIAAVIVEERLAACANIVPGVHSFYRWEGKVERADECMMLFKTTADRRDSLMARIHALHSYECPCIVASEIIAGNSDYLAWIQNSTE